VNPFTLKPSVAVRFAADLTKAARVIGLIIHPQGRRGGFSCEIEREGDTPFVSRAWTVLTNSEPKPVAVLVWARVQYADGSTDLVPLVAVEGGAL
jgi:hypothetical protein